MGKNHGVLHVFCGLTQKRLDANAGILTRKKCVEFRRFDGPIEPAWAHDWSLVSCAVSQNQPHHLPYKCLSLLLMEEILHQMIWRIYH